MFRKMVAFLLLLACAKLLAQGAPPRPQVDADEIRRWGDRVVVSGEGPRAASEQLFTLAMAPPESDSDQWYVTLWGRSDSDALKKLIKAFESDANLTAFVAAPPGLNAAGKPMRPWAHFNVYHADDPTQAWRYKDWQIPVDITSPVVTISPPRNGAWNFKGQYAVVDLIQTKDLPDAASLAKRIAASVKAYCKKIEQTGPAPQSYGFRQSGDAPIGRDDRIPWNAPPPQSPFNPIFQTPTGPAVPASLTLEEIQAAVPGATSDFLLKMLAQKPTSKEQVALAWMLEQKSGGGSFFFPTENTVWAILVGCGLAVAFYLGRTTTGKATAATGDDLGRRLRALEIASQTGLRPTATNPS